MRAHVSPLSSTDVSKFEIIFDTIFRLSKFVVMSFLRLYILGALTSSLIGKQSFSCWINHVGLLYTTTAAVAKLFSLKQT